MMDFAASLAEFAGASDLLKPRQGVTSLEQLVRETNKKEKEKKNQAEKRERAARESLEAQQEVEELVLPDITAGGLPADSTIEPDKPEPDSQQQCLFPDLAEPAPAVQLEDCDLQQGALPPPSAEAASDAAEHSEAAGVAARAAQLAQQDFVRQLLAGGMLPEYCRVSGGCSAGIAQELFRLMALSPDITVATASFDVFVSILGQRPSCYPLAEPMAVDAAEAAEFDGPRADGGNIGWLPGDDALLAVLHSCGYRSPGAAGDAKPIKSPSKGGGGKPPKAAAAGQKRSRAADSPGGGEGAAPPPGPLLARLRLLLRFIPALCRYDQEHEGAKRRGGLRPAGLQRLVAALLRLRLDPAAAPLACELQAALEALLRAWPSDKEWRAALPALATDVSKLGPSHRAHLAVLHALPAHAPRGAQLQAAAATLLLHRLVPPLFKSKAAAPPSSLLDIDAQEVVQALWWQAHSGETKRAAQAAFKGSGKFDVYELDTAVQAADLLLWPDTLALAQRMNADKKREGDVERAKYIKGAGWHTTLRVIHNEMRNISGGWQVPAIRLAGHVDCIGQRNRLALQPQLG